MYHYHINLNAQHRCSKTDLHISEILLAIATTDTRQGF